MKQITYHTYYGSSPFVPWRDLVADARKEASRTHGFNEWKLEGVYEYDREIYDERGRLLDIEARVVLKHVH